MNPNAKDDSDLNPAGGGNTPNCPFCESENIEQVSTFGSSLMGRQLFCRDCHTHFDAIRWTERNQEAPNGS